MKPTGPAIVLTLVLSLIVVLSPAHAAPVNPGGNTRVFLPVINRSLAPSLAVSLEAVPLEVAPGGIVAIATNFVNFGLLPIAVDVTLSVSDPEGVEVFRRTYLGHDLGPNQGNNACEDLAIAPTASEGDYSLGVSVSLAHSSLMVYENKSLGTIAVRKPGPTASPTPISPTATSEPPTETPTPTATATPTPTATATPTSAAGPIHWGVNISGAPGDMSKLSSWERDVTGKAVSIVHWGHFWGTSGRYRPWSNANVDNARAHGSIPMISWTPEGGDPSQWQLKKIINGTHDAYIRQFATDAKKWGYPFLLRIMHEMNGSWGYPWQETQNGNTRGEFVQAWRHIVDIFRQVGVTNVSYIWCPNVDYPGTTNPTFASLYPGDSYVDWTCLDGYNWGTNRPSGWQSFDQIFGYSYDEILKFAPSKPVMIGEFGSVEQGGSKANWLTDALNAQLPEKYNRVRGLVYFNFQFDGVDWRIETSQASKDAWRAGIASSYFYRNEFDSITGKVAVP